MQQFGITAILDCNGKLTDRLKSVKYNIYSIDHLKTCQHNVN